MPVLKCCAGMLCYKMFLFKEEKSPPTHEKKQREYLLFVPILPGDLNVFVTRINILTILFNNFEN